MSDPEHSDCPFFEILLFDVACALVSLKLSPEDVYSIAICELLERFQIDNATFPHSTLSDHSGASYAIYDGAIAICMHAIEDSLRFRHIQHTLILSSTQRTIRSKWHSFKLRTQLTATNIEAHSDFYRQNYDS